MCVKRGWEYSPNFWELKDFVFLLYLNMGKTGKDSVHTLHSQATSCQKCVQIKVWSDRRGAEKTGSPTRCCRRCPRCRSCCPPWPGGRRWHCWLRRWAARLPSPTPAAWGRPEHCGFPPHCSPTAKEEKTGGTGVTKRKQTTENRRKEQDTPQARVVTDILLKNPLFCFFPFCP